MQRKTRQFIDRTYSVTGTLIYTIMWVIFVLGGIGVSLAAVNQFGVWQNSFYATYFAGLKPILNSLIVAFIMLLVLLISLHPFTIKNQTRTLSEEIPSPLQNLSPAGEKAVVSLLREKGKPQAGKDTMNRAEVVHILQALMEQKYIDRGADTYSLQLWVTKVTGYSETDKDHFKESMDDTTTARNKVARYKVLLSERLAEVTEV